MEHGNRAYSSGNKSLGRGGLEPIFKLRKLLETLAQEAAGKNVFATKIRVGHSRPGKGRDVLNYIRGNPQLAKRRLSEQQPSRSAQPMSHERRFWHYQFRCPKKLHFGLGRVRYLFEVWKDGSD